MENENSIEIYLNNSLKKSANMIYDVANNHCHNGIMAQNCSWYHSIWQYLRMLDVVSSPTWHNDFYIEQFNKAINGKNTCNILISGTADYSMLAYVIYITQKRKIKANIYVLDTCKTPLIACEWFAKTENVEITCINDSILNYGNNNFFDIICTDAFLTRFSSQDANLVIDKWYNLLKDNGKIITTIRIHNENESSHSSNIDNFIRKITERYEYFKNDIGITFDELIEKAKEYAQNMTSNNIGNEKEIIKKFENFNIDYNVKKVPGELSETNYIELVAQKKEGIIMNNYLLLHGSFGSPFSNWIPYLRKEIESRNLEVYTPDFPTGVKYQNFDTWNKLLKIYVDSGLINENTIIYAHSIAPAFISKFLIQNKIKVKRLIFVCGFNNYFGINEDYDFVNKTMYTDKLEEIKNYCDDIICYYSKNDPYVKYYAEKEFADTVTNQQIVIDDGGHLNSESGYEQFDRLLNHL